MSRMLGAISILILGLSIAAAEAAQDKPATPAVQYDTLLKEYLDARQAPSKAETEKRRDSVSLKILELAEKNPQDPIAVDALIEMVWRSMPRNDKALVLLERDHARSDRLIQLRQQTAFGSPQDVTIFQQIAYDPRKECEALLRTVLDVNPHREVQAQACLGLALFNMSRMSRLQYLKELSESRKGSEDPVVRENIKQLQAHDPAKMAREAEALLERAVEQYADAKFPSGGTVGERAKSYLFTIHDLVVGKEVPDIEAGDQDGKRFKLSDYRGKVVLLYFWNQY